MNVNKEDSEELVNILNEPALEIFTWRTKNYTSLRRVQIKGVEELNELSNKDFCDYLYEFSNNTNIIKKVKDNNIDVNWKHDINNGVFSMLQLNKHLSKEKYELLSKLRDRLWINKYEYLSKQDLKELFNFDDLDFIFDCN